VLNIGRNRRAIEARVHLAGCRTINVQIRRGTAIEFEAIMTATTNQAA